MNTYVNMSINMSIIAIDLFCKTVAFEQVASWEAANKKQGEGEGKAKCESNSRL
jgi:hypothetical protein